jgi:hypothetical protein
MKSRIAAIERPRCPNCKERMVLVREVAGVLASTFGRSNAPNAAKTKSLRQKTR